MEGIWSQVRREIGRRHRHARVLEKEVHLVLLFSGVRVVVCVCPASETDVVILAEVGDVRAVDAVVALRLNSTLVRGALAMVGNTYVVRLRTDHVDGDALEGHVQQIAATAATIKARLRHSCDGEVFRFYVE